MTANKALHQMRRDLTTMSIRAANIATDSTASPETRKAAANTEKKLDEIRRELFKLSEEN